MLSKTALNFGSVRVVSNIYSLKHFTAPSVTQQGLLQDAKSATQSKVSERETLKSNGDLIGNICDGHDKPTQINSGYGRNWRHENDPTTRRQKLAACLIRLSCQERLSSPRIVLSVARYVNSRLITMIIQNHYKLGGFAMSVIQTIKSWVWVYSFKEAVRK